MFVRFCSTFTPPRHREFTRARRDVRWGIRVKMSGLRRVCISLAGTLILSVKVNDNCTAG
jgi:hypothetical protein